MVEAAELQSRTSDLTAEAFEAFADDIATMFDSTVRAEAVDVGQGTVADLKHDYKKLAGVCTVQAEGELHGTFSVVFDKEGLFTLAGTFVMQPEAVITQNRRSGTETEAAEIGDALGEVCNLLVGSWDRVFREEMPEHGHFKQTGTFFGNVFSDPEKSFGFSADETVDILTFEMTVDPFPPFRCAALYPASLFEPKAADETREADEADQTPSSEETAEAAEAEAPAAEPSEDGEPETVSDEAGAPEAAEEPEADEASDDVVRAGDNEQIAASESEAADEALESPEASESDAEDSSPAEGLGVPGPVVESIMRMTRSAPVLPGEGAATIIHELCAGDIMRKDVAWADPEATVEELIAIMQQHDTGYVLIGTGGRVEGIVSKSDVRGALSPYLRSMFVKWRGPMDIATLQIKAKWVMSRPVRMVRADATLAVVMRTMSEHGGRCMPVVDDKRKVLGIVTVFELFGAMLTGGGVDTQAGSPAPAVPLV